MAADAIPRIKDEKSIQSSPQEELNGSPTEIGQLPLGKSALYVLKGPDMACLPL